MIRTLSALMMMCLLAFALAGLLPAQEAKVPAGLEINTVKIPGTTVSFEMVRIPAGKIEMPPKEPGGEPVVVEIKPIWVGRTELTFEAYDIFYMQLDLTEDQKAAGVDAESRPSKPYGAPDRGFGHDGYAAISVHSRGAIEFCNWLSKKTGKKYRLLTAAEWAYACRAGGPPVKLDREALSEVAWFADNSDEQPHPVASKKPNAWGLYDMLGNVGEWVIGMDGKPMLAGGTWRDRAAQVHCGALVPYSIEWQFTDPQEPKSTWWLSDGPHVGFRIARED